DRLVHAVGTLLAPAPGELGGLARERARMTIRATDFDASLDVAGARRRLAALALLLVVPVVFAAAVPAVAGLWARRWLLGSDEPGPQDTWLSIAGLRDGRLVVAAREPFTLRVSAREGTKIPDAVEAQWEIDGGARKAAAMERSETNVFVAEMPAVTTD